MAGEDEIDDLQDQKDGRFYENTLADEGGTGQLAGYGDSYIDELTDTDERPAKQSVQQGNDASSEFSNFGKEAEYTNQFGDDDEADDDENFNGDDEDFDNDAEDFDGDDDEPESKFGSMIRHGGADDDDDEEQDDEDEDENDEEGDDDDSEGGGKGEKGKKDKNQKGKGQSGDNKQKQKGKNKKPKIDPYDGVIKWRPGQPITVELLQKVWNKIISVEKVKNLLESANEAVSRGLDAVAGPKLMLKLNKYIDNIKDGVNDTISSLLKLVSSNGKLMLFGSLSVAAAFISQQWTEPLIIFGLPTALAAAVALPAVKSILSKIFRIAVPVINWKSRKDQKK